MKTKLCRPILIKSKNPSKLQLSKRDDSLVFHPNITTDFNCFQESHWTPQELILVSLDPDDKIKISDKYLDDCDLIREAVTDDKDYWERRKDYQKVIVTQDQMPPDYIKQFIDEYNNGRIQDVEIKMKKELEIDEKESIIHCRDVFISVNKPKLTNGFITIIEHKKYTLQEISNAFKLEGINYTIGFLKTIFDI